MKHCVLVQIFLLLRRRDFLRVADVDDVARDDRAVERGAGIEVDIEVAACVVVAAISIMTPSDERAAGLFEIMSFDTVGWRRTLCVSTIGVSPVAVIVSSRQASIYCSLSLFLCGSKQRAAGSESLPPFFPRVRSSCSVCIFVLRS